MYIIPIYVFIINFYLIYDSLQIITNSILVYLKIIAILGG